MKPQYNYIEAFLCMTILKEIFKYCDNLTNDSADSDDEEFIIKNGKDSIVIGSSKQENVKGKIAFVKKAVQNGGVRCLTVGTTGSGKSYTTRSIIEAFIEEGGSSNIILDPEGEYYTLREKYDLVIAGADEDECDLVLEETLEGRDGLVFSNIISATSLGEKVAQNKMNVILDLNHLDEELQQNIATNFLKSLRLNKTGKNRGKLIPTNIFIEEAAVFAKQRNSSESNKKCKYVLTDLARRGRKYAICTFFNTQRLPQLHNDITAECDTKILGHCKEESDIERYKAFLGIRKLKTVREMIRSIRKPKYEFFILGDSFDHSYEYEESVRFKCNPIKTKHLRILDKEPGYIPEKTDVVCKWIMKLLDKDVEIQDSDEKSDSKKSEPENKESAPLIEETEDELIFKIIRALGSISFRDLHLLTKRDDYDLINTSFEYTLLFNNKEDYDVDDNIITYMGDSSEEFPLNLEELVNFWIKSVDNVSFKHLIKHLYSRENSSNSLEELSEELDIEVQKLVSTIFSYEKLNLIKINEGYAYLNPLLLYDKELEEDEENDYEDFENIEDFDEF